MGVLASFPLLMSCVKKLYYIFMHSNSTYYVLECLDNLYNMSLEREDIKNMN